MDFNSQNASVAEIIRHLMVRRNLSTSELADKLNTSRQNLSNKLRRDNFCVSDLRDITDALGYEVIFYFKDKLDKEE